MPFLDKSNMVDGNIIPASDVYQIVNAFTYIGSYDLLIKGKVSTGTGSIRPDASFYILNNLRVDGGITGSLSGSVNFAVSSSYALSSSYAESASYAETSSYSYTSSVSLTAITASYAANADVDVDTSNLLTTASFNTFTASYFTTSASFNTRIASVSNSIANLSQIHSGSTVVATYDDDRVLVSGDNDILFIVSGSGSFTGTVEAESFYQTSLRILKENIAPFSASAVDVIKTVNVVSYTYKRHRDEFKIGIIADDTHEYIASKDHNHLDTGNSIGLLFKAIQELSAEVEKLKKNK